MTYLGRRILEAISRKILVDLGMARLTNQRSTLCLQGSSELSSGWNPQSQNTNEKKTFQRVWGPVEPFEAEALLDDVVVLVADAWRNDRYSYFVQHSLGIQLI